MSIVTTRHDRNETKAKRGETRETLGRILVDRPLDYKPGLKIFSNRGSSIGERASLRNHLNERWKREKNEEAEERVGRTEEVHVAARARKNFPPVSL